MLRLFGLCLAMAFVGSQLWAAEVGSMFPFVLPWDDSSAGVTNVSSLLEKPAGKHGFVTPKDGHLYVGAERIRFFGVNFCFSGSFPSHDDAAKVAARLAKFGVNCVRFHHMDNRTAPGGILNADMRTLDPDQLDRLDYLISQLKLKGIYADLNLHVSRNYPGMAKWQGMPNYFKGVDNFYSGMIAMQTDYARELLTHRNPYTGLKYVDEPAVAFIEINNENGLFHEWWNGALDEMPDVYSNQLKDLWNSWLNSRYRSTADLRKAWKSRTEPEGREMLSNGDFSQGMTNWVLQRIDGAEADGEKSADTRVDSFMDIVVTKQAALKWHVQLYQTGLEFRKGMPYTLTFKARADSSRRIVVNAMQAQEPWGHIWSKPVDLASGWNKFRFTFIPDRDETSARITFSDLGQKGTEFRFTNVSLKPGGYVGLPAGEELGAVNILKRSDTAGQTTEQRKDWIEFLCETETNYWTGMSRYIKEDLKAHSSVIGTQANFSPIWVQAKLDVVDAHAYWKHPHFPGKPWDPENWTVENVPMSASESGGTLPRLAMSRVAGKPFVVTEYNHPAPNTYSSEAFLLLAAYASMQDWDGIFAFDYTSRLDNLGLQRIPSFFSIDQHPTKMATLPAAAAVFLRGDLKTPIPGAIVSLTPEKALDAAMTSGPRVNAAALGVTNREALEAPVSVLLSQVVRKTQSKPGKGTEFFWHPAAKPEVVTLNTARSKMVIGKTGLGPVDLGGVVIDPGRNLQDWAAISLTVMQGRDFTSPGSILITATGYTENTGMGWKSKEKTSVGRDWGTAPSLVEGIPAAITLPVDGKRVRVWTLDERGQRRDELPVESVDGKTVVRIGPEYKTLWYEVSVGDGDGLGDGTDRPG